MEVEEVRKGNSYAKKTKRQDERDMMRLKKTLTFVLVLSRVLH